MNPQALSSGVLIVFRTCQMALTNNIWWGSHPRGRFIGSPTILWMSRSSREFVFLLMGARCLSITRMPESLLSSQAPGKQKMGDEGGEPGAHLAPHGLAITYPFLASQGLILPFFSLFLWLPSVLIVPTFL